MIYPDISFMKSTKIILFLFNCIVTTLAYYWGADILLQLYQHKINFKNKFLYSFISAILLNIIPVYAFSAVKKAIIYSEHLDIGVYFNFIKIMFPLSYFILYLLGIYILYLPKIKAIKIMQLSYIYYICCSLLLKIFGDSLFPQRSDLRGWNYLSDIFMLLTGTTAIFLFYILVGFYINKSKLHIKFTNSLVSKNIKYELGKNFTICFGIYCFVLTGCYYPKLDGIHSFFIFLICFCYIIISIMKDYFKIHRERLENKDEHIITLNESIEEFKGIKNDFSNILQTYSGYLTIGDMNKLKLYHQKVLKTTISAETRLGISQRMYENPSFFSIILNKLERAQKKGITIQLSLVCNMEDIYIDELDFTRIMAILLDNAIEAAEQTPLKRISLSNQLKPDGSKLFILTNDTNHEINIANLFISHYTTKAGHMGQGLAQIRSTLCNYENSSFNLVSNKKEFSAYLELKPNILQQLAEPSKTFKT